MRVLILGGDGYLGWPTALRFSRLGDEVILVDNFLRRQMHQERGTESLTAIRPMKERLHVWKRQSGKDLAFFDGDLRNDAFVFQVVRDVRPDVVIHYGEIPSERRQDQRVATRGEGWTVHDNDVVGPLERSHEVRHARRAEQLRSRRAPGSAADEVEILVVRRLDDLLPRPLLQVVDQTR